MPFNPNANQLITIETAAIYTAKYRKTFPNTVIANAYVKNQMLSLLNQNNCEGFRIYNGIDENGAQQLVIVGVDADGNDLYHGLIMDCSQPCPTICSTTNPLNTNS